MPDTTADHRRRRAVRRRLRGRVLAVLAVIASISVAPRLQAATPAATLDAVASAPVPPPASIAVAAGEPDERTALLLPLVAETLASRGYEVRTAAALTLRVSSTVTRLADDRRPFRLSGTVGSASRPDVTLEVPLPAWPGPRQDQAAYRYSIAMVLGAAGQPAIWQGAVTALRPTADDLAAEQRMAAGLAGKLGLSAKAEPLPLD